MALLKPGKDPSGAKSFRAISLLCHTYKLFERLILNRVAEHVDAKLIPEQAGFRPGKSCTSQLLMNLTEHNEDGYEKRLITGAVFVDLSAAYDTVNHRRLLSNLPEMTGDVHLTDLIRTMLEGRSFFVVLNGKKSRWRRQRKGLPQGSLLAPMLFNIYTNDQPIHADTRSVIYADDMCIASQGDDFNNIEASLTSALSTMTTHYDTNQLRANPSKTHVCAFHLRNREAKRELNVVWNDIRLSNTTTPVHRRTGQHPFGGGGAAPVLPGWIQWGGGVAAEVSEVFRDPYSVGGGVVAYIFREPYSVGWQKFFR